MIGSSPARPTPGAKNMIRRPRATPERHEGEKAACHRNGLVEVDQLLGISPIGVKQDRCQDAETGKRRGRQTRCSDFSTDRASAFR
jgi:hypothetical protein